MQGEKIEINGAFVNDSSYFPHGMAQDDSYYFAIQRLLKHLQKNGGYKMSTNQTSGNIILSIECANITINLEKQTEDYAETCHVCLWEATSYRYDDILRMKRFVATYQKLHPNTPIILYAFEGSLKSRPSYCKESLLEGYKLLTPKRGTALAQEIGAVKYVEYNVETGRGAKILLDEITHAGIGVIVDEMQSHERRKQTMAAIAAITIVPFATAAVARVIYCKFF